MQKLQRASNCTGTLDHVPDPETASIAIPSWGTGQITSKAAIIGISVSAANICMSQCLNG
jgi:hypothetical protein